MSRSVRRLSVILAIALAGAVLSGCAGARSGPAVAGPVQPSTPPGAGPVQPYGPYPTLPPTAGNPPVGNTDQRYPELSVAREDGYAIDLVDPEARAWWIVVAGSRAAVGDRLEFVAEAGDVSPGVAVKLYVGGQLVDTVDMNGLVGSETAIAGGCHPTLHLCFTSAEVEVRPGDGTLSVRIEALGPGPFQVRGATASWDGESFVLGPWRGTGTVATG